MTVTLKKLAKPLPGAFTLSPPPQRAQEPPGQRRTFWLSGHLPLQSSTAGQAGCGKRPPWRDGLLAGRYPTLSSDRFRGWGGGDPAILDNPDQHGVCPELAPGTQSLFSFWFKSHFQPYPEVCLSVQCSTGPHASWSRSDQLTGEETRDDGGEPSPPSLAPNGA